MKPHVHKCGGASLADADAFAHAVLILKDQAAVHPDVPSPRVRGSWPGTALRNAMQMFDLHGAQP